MKKGRIPCMNSLILSFLVLVTFCFHLSLRSRIKHDKVRESFCALWCVDACFAICGTAISVSLYDYCLLSFFTGRNILICLLFLLLTVLLLFVSPSGYGLFRKHKEYSKTDILLAEYRFNDTLRYVRSFFMTLLFITPVLLSIGDYFNPNFLQFSGWSGQGICGAVCFISFLLLVPISLRQTIFWLHNLIDAPTPEEDILLKAYKSDVHFHKHNFRI